jgi:hypothetical protein
MFLTHAHKEACTLWEKEIVPSNRVPHIESSCMCMEVVLSCNGGPVLRCADTWGTNGASISRAIPWRRSSAKRGKSLDSVESSSAHPKGDHRSTWGFSHLESRFYPKNPHGIGGSASETVAWVLHACSQSEQDTPKPSAGDTPSWVFLKHTERMLTNELTEQAGLLMGPWLEFYNPHIYIKGA